MGELNDSDRAVMILTSLRERASRRPPGKGLTRARFTSRTLKKLCDLEKITQASIDRVNESLLKAGWILIDAGSTYGAIKVSVVENWPRAISKNVMTDLAKLKQGKFEPAERERLMRRETWETTSHLSSAKSRSKAVP
jgi:hypothetical protein